MSDSNSSMKIFVKDLDDITFNQFKECSSKDFVISSALMPDAHSGYTAPIGSVFLTKEFIVPSWVGFDIGCGMIACRLKSELEFDELFNLINNKKVEIFNEVINQIPMGKSRLNHINNISTSTKNSFKDLLEKFKSNNYSNEIFKIIKNKSLSNLGTLGGGNHFIELGISLDFNNKRSKYLWVIIHSGSRNIGKKIAEYYMKKAMELNLNNDVKFKNKDNFNRVDIEDSNGIKYDSELGKEYLNAVNFCLDFALLNRLEMMNKILISLNKILGIQVEFELWTNKNHNHVIKFSDNLFIHRKGATPAELNERGVIPANMRDGSFLIEGLGNKEFLFSSSHGAGRKLSRKKAKEELDLNEFKKMMTGIISKTSKEYLDESPDAYKDIFEVMELQKESVKILTHIKPIINWKGD